MPQYMALYRKWRPSVFADVIGQDHITKVLRSEIMQKSVSQAYLLCGSRGTGKTTCAKILAKAVSCENPVDGDPCGVCEKCKAFENSLDIVEMDAASNNSVNDIRELRDRISFMPIELSRKVYIIDEVHMLSVSAFNALLKTLEEPPAHVMFILATTELNKIPATILSRCKRFDFHRISPEDMMPRLRTISDSENIGIDDAALGLIARLATGAMRDALSMLELFVGQQNIDREKAASMLGVIGNATVLSLLQSIADKDAASALETVEQAYKTSKDMSVLCTELGGMFRNLLVMKYASSHVSSLIDEGADVIEALRNCEDKFSSERLLYCTEVVEDTQNKLSRNALSRRTLIELMIMRLCDSKLSVSPSALLERVSALESGAVRISGAAVSKPVSRQSSADAVSSKQQNTESAHGADAQPDAVFSDGSPIPEPPSQDFGEDPALYGAGNVTEKENVTNGEKNQSSVSSDAPGKPMTAYAEVLEDIKAKDMMLYSLISSGRAYIKDDTMTLNVSKIAKFMVNSDPKYKTLIEELSSAKLGYAVNLVLGELTKAEEQPADDLGGF